MKWDLTNALFEDFPATTLVVVHGAEDHSPEGSAGTCTMCIDASHVGSMRRMRDPFLSQASICTVRECDFKK